MQAASIGRVVHYVTTSSTPGADYAQECTAAIITCVDSLTAEYVSLAILAPTGLSFTQRCLHVEPERMRTGTVYTSDSWHWPERVE